MAKISEQDAGLKKLIAQRIRTLREQTTLTQSEFASKNDIDRQTLNRWENGRGVTIYTINRFCKLIDIDLKAFFNDSVFN